MQSLSSRSSVVIEGGQKGAQAKAHFHLTLPGVGLLNKKALIIAVAIVAVVVKTIIYAKECRYNGQLFTIGSIEKRSKQKHLEEVRRLIIY